MRYAQPMPPTKKTAVKKPVDVDRLLTEQPAEGQPVTIKFRGALWEFRPITEAPLSLFSGELDDAHASAQFLQAMLVDGSDPLPDDVNLREAGVLVQAYTEAATDGIELGE